MPMFDCPEQSQTSPERTFLSSRVFCPLTVMVNGPPAAGVRSFRLQVPSPAAVVDAVAPHDAVTAIFSPGCAQPQNAAAVSRCTTMLSLNNDASRTSARAPFPNIATATSANILFIGILMSFCTRRCRAVDSVTFRTGSPVRPENGPSIRLRTPGVNAGPLKNGIVRLLF